MKLSVKITNKDDSKILSLTVPDNATVDDLKIAAIISLPNSINSQNHLTSKDINLWYSGHKLDHSKSLKSYHITPDNLILNPNLTIHLTLDDNNIDNNTNNTNKRHVDPIQSDSAIIDDDDDDVSELDPTNHEIKKSKKSGSSSSSSSKSSSKSRSKSKSKKCSFHNCNSTPLRIVGDCQFCQGKFCSKHRLLESHNCKGLKICKDKCYERNALKLQSEQTVASKV